MEEKWINDLRNKMTKLESSAPDGLWEQIELSMEEKKYSSKGFSRKIIGLTTGICAAVVAVTLTIVFLGKKDPSSSVFTNNIIKNTALNEKGSKTSTNNKSYIIQNRLSALHSVLTKLEISTIEDSSQNSFVHKDSIISPNTTYSREKEEPTPSVNKNATTETTHKKPHSNIRSDRGYNLNKTINISTSNTEKLALSAYVSNIPENNIQRNMYGSSTLSSVDAGGLTAEEDNMIKEIYGKNQDQPTNTRTSYKQPFRIGISVQFMLNNKFGIGCGFIYSYLSSNTSSGSENNYTEEQQSLYYLGIPINVNYNIWQSKKWKVYASLGSQVEKCISGNSHIDYVIENKVQSTKGHNVSESTLQLSANGSAGLQFNISKQLGVYVEPGLNYHFNNGSSVKNIYKDKPLNFSLGIGLRFTIK